MTDSFLAPGKQFEVRLDRCHDAALAVGLVVLQIPDQGEEADYAPRVLDFFPSILILQISFQLSRSVL